ncbi:MAG: carbon starvation protein A [Candidatus Pacearchaeota archaeon]
MNALIILLIAALWLFLGYRFYSKFIENKLKISDKHKTPAVTQRDNIDYSPSKRPFLIGHHFASIAGAGPIIGPILAVSYFGWLPTVLWVLIGVVFIGAMHDYVSLIASVRNKAKGVAVIVKKYLNSRAGWVFGLMIWITLILIITVFAVSSAESIVEKPDLVIPLVGITLIAIVLGIGTQKYKWNDKISSLIAIIFVFFFVWIGNMYPITLPFSAAIVKNIWISIIMMYAFFASVTPVWALLRPRDFLSAIQMGLILILGLVAIAIINPSINAPAYISGSVFPLWPILFITVACGAISGFHGLVASGTTSKQLAKESHGRSVGYGSMIGEATLAILVILVSIAGLKWGAGIEGGFQVSLEKGWIVLFSEGFGNIVGQLNLPLIGFGIAALLGAFMVNQFILTSVDTSTRLGRFVLSETLFPKIKNRVVTTLITLVPAWILAVTGSYEELWRLFGTSNQLIASITLIGVAAFLVAKKTSVKFIIIPALFILVTTMSALIYLTFSSSGFVSNGNFVLAGISILMFVLGLFVAWEGFGVLRKKS